MTNFDEFYGQAENWARKNTNYFSLEKANIIKENQAFLEGYFGLPEGFIEKTDNYDGLEIPLQKLYVLEKYINKGTIVL